MDLCSCEISPSLTANAVTVVGGELFLSRCRFAGGKTCIAAKNAVVLVDQSLVCVRFASECERCTI